MTLWRLARIGLLATLLCPGLPAWAADEKTCADLADKTYTVCSVRSGDPGLRLFLEGENGHVYGSFPAVSTALAAKGERLVFAMNAGMYQRDLQPAGLYVEAGRQAKAVNTRGGFGNFHMKPNGVFWIGPQGAAVTETAKFTQLHASPAYATQSGPMLVIDGRLHPRFRAAADSRKIRNGVGVCRDGRTRFVISNTPVTFHDFATLFRDRLGCPNALYLDGSISALLAPELGRSDGWRPMGPIVGLVGKAR